MRRPSPRFPLPLLLLAAFGAGVLVGPTSRLFETARAGDAAPAPRDAAALRLRLLARWDAAIDERCAQAHLDARLTLDDVVPVPYLGIDADPETDPAGMKVTHVYPLTGAERVGLRVGDVLVSVGGVPTPDAAALGGIIRTHQVGDLLAFVVKRGDAELHLEAPLGHRPEEDEDEAEQFPALRAPEAGPPSPVSVDFDGTKAGTSPSGLRFVLAGHGDPGRWIVHREGDATFLRQEADDASGIRFPIALADGFHAHDALVSVRFRASGGRQDRAAGVVVRLQDRWNYIVARANRIEGDVRIFRVVDGLRRTLPGARALVELAPGWHRLSLRAQGPKLEAVLDGETTISSYDTYVTGDEVGLWTKSDSVIDFDDFEAGAL